MNELQDEISRWNWEVEVEMVRLIKRGVPLYDAGRQARDIVSLRRQVAAEGAKP